MLKIARKSAYFALILRDSEGAMLELRICVEDQGAADLQTSSWISLQLRGLLFQWLEIGGRYHNLQYWL